MKLFWQRVVPNGSEKTANQHTPSRSMGWLPQRWMLVGCLVGLVFSALACSEEPASDRESPLASRVDSAPPTGELGGTRNSTRAAARNRKAREASNRWTPLLASGASEQAQVLCEGWLGESDEGQYGEAHKCLANVEIATARSRPGGEKGGGAAGSRAAISRARSSAAVEHYDAAIAAVPLDSDAHIGRVDVLILAGRYREANIALDSSLEFFSSRMHLDKWFRLLGRFQRPGQIDEGLAFLRVIEKHHPLDHRVMSNLGAFYAMTGNGEKAVEYSERAVAINPDDPINKWNLARIYDKQGRLEEADRHYLEALAVFGDEDPEARCDYAEFIGTRLGDIARACNFAETNCEKQFDAHCKDTSGMDGADGAADEPDPRTG